MSLMSNYPNGFSNGVSIFGMPILNTYTGNVFYVHSGTGSNSNSGTVSKPFATIDYAVERCTANNGDLIIVKQGHAEVVSAAGGLDLDVAGITIMGMGQGANMPTVTLTTATTADVDIDAANVTIMGIHFVSGFADIAVGIDVNADDFSLLNCRFSQSAVDLNTLIWVQDAAAGGSDRITIQGCHVMAIDAANTHFVNFAGTGDGHKVIGNTLIGDWGTMAIGGAGVITNATIMYNSISNAATTNDAAINLAATATGVVMHNYACGGAAQANGFTATGCAKAQNYYGVLAEDASAILDPVAT
jgi:hypothetical protein